MSDEETVLETESNPEIEVEPQEAQKSNLQSRIDKITRQKYEAIQEADLVKKQNVELQTKLDTFNNAPEVEPTLENHDYDQDSFDQAVIDQRAEVVAKRIISERDKQAEEGALADVNAKKAKEFASREAKFATQFDDYDEIARSATLPISESMANVISESENGPAIAYHLGKNPEKAYAISQMDDYSAQREMMKIELGFDKPNTITQAPEPIPDGIGGGEVPIVDGDNLSINEWMKRRNKQVHG